MKLRYLLVIAFALIVPAQFASATPVDPMDPSVIINHCKTACDLTTFSTNSAVDPLVITLNSEGVEPVPEVFEYIGTSTLTQLYVRIDGALPLEEFDCVSDIFTGCGSFSTGVSDEVGLIFEDGALSHDEIFTAAVATPEPGTIVLLLTGGVLLFGLGRRW